METKFRLSHSWCTHVKLEPGHGARLAMFSARFKESSWKHCHPGAIHNGTLALLNGTCILFPEMRPVFEQKSWEPRSYKGHIQCLLHLLEPSKPRSRSGSPWKNKFRAVHKVVYSSKFAFQQQCQPVPADMVAISLKAHFYGKILEGWRCFLFHIMIHVWSLSRKAKDPWGWYFYLHEWVIFMVHVGKYASLMDPMGMSTKELRSLNSSHYCNTNFLVLSDKSGWKHGQPGAMPRFQFDNLTWVHQLDSMGPAFSFQKWDQSWNRNRENPEVIKTLIQGKLLYGAPQTCLWNKHTKKNTPGTCNSYM